MSALITATLLIDGSGAVLGNSQAVAVMEEAMPRM